METNKIATFIKNNKIHVIIWAVGLAFLGFFIYNKLTEPSYLFRAYLLNTSVEEGDKATEELTKEFVKKYNIDTDQGDVLLDVSHAFNDGDTQKANSSTLAYDLFSAQANDSLNLVTGPNELMKTIAYESYAGGAPLFADLESILTEEELKLYKPYFLYLDQAVIEKLKDEHKKNDDISSIKLPDMSKPEKMKNPFPVLINISDSPKLAKIYGETNNNVALGIIDGLPTNTLALNFAEHIIFVKEE